MFLWNDCKARAAGRAMVTESQVRALIFSDAKGPAFAAENLSIRRDSGAEEAAALQSPAVLSGLCFMATW